MMQRTKDVDPNNSVEHGQNLIRSTNTDEREVVSKNQNEPALANARIGNFAQKESVKTATKTNQSYRFSKRMRENMRKHNIGNNEPMVFNLSLKKLTFLQ